MFIFSLFGIEVEVQAWFWLTAAFLSGAFFLGSSTSGLPLHEEVILVLAKVFLLLISVLIHELGHCYVLKKLGARPYIVLHGFGGFTFWRGLLPNRLQQVAISLGGPAAGFLFAAVLIAIVQVSGPNRRFFDELTRFGIWWNLYWSLFNLLPIRPLDCSHILSAALGREGENFCRSIGATLAAGIAVWFLFKGLVFIAVLFATLAYLNWKGDDAFLWFGRP